MAQSADNTPDNQVYRLLSPDALLDSLAEGGFEPDGRVLALNSYENRVYQAGLEDGGFVVAKFYRPGRWTDASASGATTGTSA